MVLLYHIYVKQNTPGPVGPGGVLRYIRDNPGGLAEDYDVALTLYGETEGFCHEA